MTVPDAHRELTAAVLGSAVAGGLALFAASQTWAAGSAVRPAPLPPVTEVLAGSAHAPSVPAAGMVLLAAAVALLAVRGSGRIAVGMLMTAGGCALAWTGVRALAGGLQEAVAVTQISPVWPAVTVVAGVVGALAGVLAVVRGRRWPAMGSRYERGTAVRGTAAAPARLRSDEDRADLAWKALDRGEDPTDPPGDRRL